MPDCPWSYGGRLLDPRDRRRPVNKGARRGITQSPKRKRRRK